MSNDYELWELVRAADVAQPDRLDSPGAVWLNDLQEAWRNWEGDRASEDERDTFARDAVYELESRGTHGRWEVFVDLGVWQDAPEVEGERDDAGDLPLGFDALAMATLERIARRFAEALADDDEWSGRNDDDDDA